jgi:MFS family permease
MSETPNTDEAPKEGLGEMAVSRDLKSDIRFTEVKRDEADTPSARDFEKPLVAPPKKDEISNKVYYYGLMINLSLYHLGNGWATVGPALILETIGNENNFNFDDGEKSVYFGLIFSMFYIGQAVSVITTNYVMKYSQKTTLIVFTILFFTCNTLVIIPHLACLFFGRFGIGLAYGTIAVIITSNLAGLSPPTKKLFGGNLYNISFSIGNLGTYFFSVGEQGNNYWWRINMFACGAILLINMIVLLIVYPGFESPTYLFRLKRDQEVRDMISKYCTPDAVKSMMKTLETMRNLEAQEPTAEKVEEAKMSYCKRIFDVHWVSTGYG